MKTNFSTPRPGLATGQLWKTDNTYLRIIELGRSLIHYQVMREPGREALVTRLIRIDALAVYLMACEATLMV
jgi:hypothetical protein